MINRLRFTISTSWPAVALKNSTPVCHSALCAASAKHLPPFHWADMRHWWGRPVGTCCHCFGLLFRSPGSSIFRKIGSDPASALTVWRRSRSPKAQRSCPWCACGFWSLLSHHCLYCFSGSDCRGRWSRMRGAGPRLGGRIFWQVFSLACDCYYMKTERDGCQAVHLVLRRKNPWKA